MKTSVKLAPTVAVLLPNDEPIILTKPNLTYRPPPPSAIGTTFDVMEDLIILTTDELDTSETARPPPEMSAVFSATTHEVIVTVVDLPVPSMIDIAPPFSTAEFFVNVQLARST
jgi:hypothetical protein